jgi:hypothetical protein
MPRVMTRRELTTTRRVELGFERLEDTRRLLLGQHLFGVGQGSPADQAEVAGVAHKEL